MTPKPLLLSLLLILGISYLPTKADAGMCFVNSLANTGTPNQCGASSPTLVSSASSSFAPNLGVGNPIHVLSGNKFEQQQDTPSIQQDDYALHLTRYYNSHSVQTGIFGVGWRSSIEMQLHDATDFIEILQADGTKYRFNKYTTTDEGVHLDKFYANDPSLGYVVRTNSHTNALAQALWYWHIPDGRRIAFTTHKQVNHTTAQGQPSYGQLLSVHQNPTIKGSAYWQLTYDTKGRVVQVDNHLGDTLKINYDPLKITITHTIKQSNQTNTYEYHQDKHHNLILVHTPMGQTAYEYTDTYDKHNLTGKYQVDEQGHKHLIYEWRYNHLDQAIDGSQKQGLQAIHIDYDKRLNTTDDTVIYTNTLTNSLGQITYYRYRYQQGQFQLLSVHGAGCYSCTTVNRAYRYDKLGRVIAQTDLDHTGQANDETSLSIEYDSQGRIKALHSTDGYRLFEYQDKRHPDKITAMIRPSVVKDKQAVNHYGYDDKGNLITLYQS